MVATTILEGAPTNPQLSKSIRGQASSWQYGLSERNWLSLGHATITGTEFMLIVKSYKDMEMALALFEHSS